MFRASLCPSSGAYQLQQQPLVYRRNVVVAVLLVVVGPTGPTTTNSTAVAKAEWALECPLSLGNSRSPYGHINQRLQVQFRAPDDERCAARNMFSLQKILE